MFEIPSQCSELKLPEHEWLATFSRHIHSMILARDSHGIDKQARGALVALPSWLMVKPETWVGSKGENNLIPARITWTKDSEEVGHLQVIEPGEKTTFAWHVDSLGIKADGTTTFTVGNRNACHGSGCIPEKVEVSDAVSDLDSEIDEIRRRGHVAQWELSSFLEPAVVRSLHDVVYSLSSEVLEHRTSIGHLTYPHSPSALDEIEIESLRDELLYEPSARTGKSPIGRLIEQSLDAKTFAKVEPLRFMATNIRREAWYSARKAIGDPYGSGVNIRRTWVKHKDHLQEVADQHGQDAAIDELVDLYHRTYSRRISPDVAKRAITITQTPSSQSQWLPESSMDILAAKSPHEGASSHQDSKIIDKAYEHSTTLGYWAEGEVPQDKDAMKLWGKALGLTFKEALELERTLTQVKRSIK